MVSGFTIHVIQVIAQIIQSTGLITMIMSYRGPEANFSSKVDSLYHPNAQLRLSSLPVRVPERHYRWLSDFFGTNSKSLISWTGISKGPLSHWVPPHIAYNNVISPLRNDADTSQGLRLLLGCFETVTFSCSPNSSLGWWTQLSNRQSKLETGIAFLRVPCIDVIGNPCYIHNKNCEHLLQ